MCNLYSMTKGQQAIRDLARATRDNAGNLPPLPAIFPDMMAPVVHSAEDGGRDLSTMRWGFPPPPKGNRPVTNVRNLDSPFWRGWLKREWRCVVPATSFCEWTDSRPKVTHWFALDESRPLFVFAGIWRVWSGERKGEQGAHRLFSILTTAANDDVRPIHAKAMPVVLTGPEEIETWLTGTLDDAAALQRPLAQGRLRVVATGPREDAAG